MKISIILGSTTLILQKSMKVITSNLQRNVIQEFIFARTNKNKETPRILMVQEFLDIFMSFLRLLLEVAAVLIERFSMAKQKTSFQLKYNKYEETTEVDSIACRSKYSLSSS